MKNTILAKRYAKALFAVGKELDALEQYNQGLRALADLFAAQPEVLDALTNPLYPIEVRGKVMTELAKAISASQEMARFLDLLVEKKRVVVLPDIADVFQAMVDDEQNISRGMVVSAAELSAELQEKLKGTLEKITQKNVVLTTEVDPSIIGGIIAKVGDLVLDGSIRTQLAGLKESIKGSE